MNKREKILLVAGGLVVAASLWFVLSPSPNTKAATAMPLEKAKAATAEALQNTKKMQDTTKELEPRIKEVTYTQPAEELVPMLIGDLQNAAKEAKIRFREMKPVRPKLVAKGTASRVPIEVRFRAPFQPNTVQFLYNIENPEGKMTLDKVSITSTDPKFKIVEVTAQVSLFTTSTEGVTGGDIGGDSADARSTRR